MRHQATRELHAYWDVMRGERTAPDRQDFDPVAIRSVLGDTFMLDVEPAATYSVCLSGERVNRLFNLGLKGQSFISLFAAPEQAKMAKLCASICDESLPVVAGLLAAPQGHTPIALEMVLLPVRHFSKTHARILGAISPAFSPEWLGEAPIEPISLVSIRMLIADHRQRRNLASPGNTLRRASEIQASACNILPVARRAHLTVYNGGR